jgi:hypothetical protein
MEIRKRRLRNENGKTRDCPLFPCTFAIAASPSRVISSSEGRVIPIFLGFLTQRGNAASTIHRIFGRSRRTAP